MLRKGSVLYDVPYHGQMQSYRERTYYHSILFFFNLGIPLERSPILLSLRVEQCHHRPNSVHVSKQSHSLARRLTIRYLHSPT